jgi:hypothetical protein
MVIETLLLYFYLGFQAIPASTPNVFETPEETEYQDGGTFNPDTDEFIGFADELPEAQEGLEKNVFYKKDKYIMPGYQAVLRFRL